MSQRVLIPVWLFALLILVQSLFAPFAVYSQSGGSISVKIKRGSGDIYVDAIGYYWADFETQGSASVSLSYSSTYIKPLSLTERVSIDARVTPSSSAPAFYGQGLSLNLSLTAEQNKGSITVDGGGSIAVGTGGNISTIDIAMRYSESPVDEKRTEFSNEQVIDIPAELAEGIESYALYLTIINTDTMNSMLRQYGITWVTYTEYSISFANLTRVYRLSMRSYGYVDHVAYATSMNMNIERYLERRGKCIDLLGQLESRHNINIHLDIDQSSIALSLDMNGSSRAENLEDVYRGLSLCLLYTAYVPLQEASLMLVQTITRTASADVVKGIEFLELYAEPFLDIVMLPSNTTINIDVSTGSLRTSFEVRNLRLGSATLTGSEAEIKVASVVYAVFEYLKNNLNVDLYVDSDVQIDSGVVASAKSNIGSIIGKLNEMGIIRFGISTTTTPTKPLETPTTSTEISITTVTHYITTTTTTTKTMTTTVTTTYTTTYTTTHTETATITERDYTLIGVSAVACLVIGVGLGYILWGRKRQ